MPFGGAAVIRHPLLYHVQAHPSCLLSTFGAGIGSGAGVGVDTPGRSGVGSGAGAGLGSGAGVGGGSGVGTPGRSGVVAFASCIRARSAKAPPQTRAARTSERRRVLAILMFLILRWSLRRGSCVWVASTRWSRRCVPLSERSLVLLSGPTGFFPSKSSVPCVRM